MTTEPNPIEMLHCNECRHKTKHQLLKEVTSNSSEDWGDDYTFHSQTVHELFQCCGCSAVVLRQSYSDSEMDGDRSWYFPPRISRHQPDWIDKMPADIQRVMREVYRCLGADSRALPMMGLRTVLDLLIMEQVEDTGTFVQKLLRLQTKGIISERNRKVLEAALDAGHAAVHRAWAPKLPQVHSVLDIVENLLQSVYLFDELAAEIRESAPQRKPKPASGP